MIDEARKVEGKVALPVARQTYQDKEDPHRRFIVDNVEVGARHGREVVGHLQAPSSLEDGKNYATDLTTFWKVWEPLTIAAATITADKIESTSIVYESNGKPQD